MNPFSKQARLRRKIGRSLGVKSSSLTDLVKVALSSPAGVERLDKILDSSSRVHLRGMDHPQVVFFDEFGGPDPLPDLQSPDEVRQWLSD